MKDIYREEYRDNILNKARLTTTGHYNVYVILLNKEAKKKYSRKYGGWKNKPAVYVGETSYTPEERIAQHKEGGFVSSRYVYNHGIELMPELYEEYNPLSSREQSELVETVLAEKLRRLGYTVLGGH